MGGNTAIQYTVLFTSCLVFTFLSSVDCAGLEDWTCDAIFFNAKDGCDCNCGTIDPDCEKQENPEIINCGAGQHCSPEGLCVSVPPSPSPTNPPTPEASIQDCSVVTCSDGLTCDEGTGLCGVYLSTVHVPESSTAVWLRGKGLTGRIPKEISLLERLTLLDVSNNAFTGPIPEEVGELQKLSFIFMSNNQLTGLVPTSLLQLQDLQYLHLNDNAISGNFPLRFKELGKLASVQLGGNLFENNCDCEFVGKYTEFVERFGIRFDAFRSNTCSDINEYSGILPHIIRPEPEAPCSHVVVKTNITELSASSAALEWSLPGGISNDRSIVERGEVVVPYSDVVNRIGTENQDSLRSCESFRSTYSENVTILGFDVAIYDIASENTSNACYFGAELQRNCSSREDFCFSLGGLLPAREYEVIVRPFFAYFGAGTSVKYVYGPRSRPKSIVTLDDSPLDAPQHFHYETVQDREATLSWKEPEYPNGDVTGYEIEVMELGNFSVNKVGNENTPQRFLELSNLDVVTSYQIRIRARTGESNYGPYSDIIELETCPENMKKTSNSSCYAEIGFFENSVGFAERCDTLGFALGVGYCLTEGTTVQTLPIKPGFWRPSKMSSFVWKCPDQTFCSQDGFNSLGNLTDINDQCKDTHQGIFCSDCIEGYALNRTTCTLCTDDVFTTHKRAFVTVMIILLVVMVVGVLKIVCASHLFDECSSGLHGQSLNGGLIKETPSSSREISGRSWTKRKLQSSWKIWFSKLGASCRDTFNLFFKVKIRILFGFAQVFYALLPRQYYWDTEKGASVLEFVTGLSPKDLLDLFEIRCYYDTSHYDILLLYTLLPITFIGVVVSVYACITHYRRASRYKEQMKRESITTVFYLTFIIYPGVSRVILQTFMCEDFEEADGDFITTRFLGVDTRLSCEDSNERLFWIWYASIMVLVFPIGILFMYSFSLYQRSSLFEKDEEDLTAQDVENKAMVRFLTEPYRTGLYWFEAYELVRKLVQSYTNTWVSAPNAAAEDIIPNMFSLNICFVSVFILVYLKPYKDDGDFWFALLSLLLLMPLIQMKMLDLSSEQFTIGTNWLLGLEFLLMFTIGFAQLRCSRKRKTSIRMAMGSKIIQPEAESPKSDTSQDHVESKSNHTEMGEKKKTPIISIS